MEEDAPAAPPEKVERIAKVIARAGLASRREAERWIEAGRVALDGATVTTPALSVARDALITVDGTPLPARAPTRLWRFHKPRRVLTTRNVGGATSDERRTLYDRLPPVLGRVMAVGHLDPMSEGLVLLTNDGALARRLELPATGWLRRYRVRVHGRVDEAVLKGLAQGGTFGAIRYEGVTATLDRQQGANAWVTVALAEGRGREIRHLLEALDFSVTRLIRLAFGPFQLGGLERGAIEEVPRRVLKDQIGVNPDGHAHHRR